MFAIQYGNIDVPVLRSVINNINIGSFEHSLKKYNFTGIFLI